MAHLYRKNISGVQKYLHDIKYAPNSVILEGCLTVRLPHEIK